MIKYRNRVARTTNILIDSSIVFVAVVTTFLIRAFVSRYISLPYAATMSDYIWVIVVIIPLWNFMLYMNGLYPTNRLRPFSQVFWIIFKATIGGIAFCIFLLFVFKLQFIGRIAVFLFAFLSFDMLVVKEALVRESLKRKRAKGIGLRNVMIIGEKKLASRVIDKINLNPYLGLSFSGIIFFEEEEEHVEDTFMGVKVFTGERDVRLLLLENNIDLVIMAVAKEGLPEIEELILKAEEFGAEIWLYADFFELMFAEKEIDTLEDIPFLIFRTTPHPSWPMAFKRMLDIVGSAVLLVVTSPIFLFAAIMVKLTSPGGPAIFQQKRVGLHGRKFVFYKFRSMVTDAEQRRKELLGRNIMSGPAFKMKDDPRVTSFGKFMRRRSIDELPQLWNVFRGDMSLVGPRPPLPREVSEYRGWQRRRLSMRPGLTCLWQVEGRSMITDFDTWAELDLKYIDSWSLWLDMVILVKTFFVVLFKTGAE